MDVASPPAPCLHLRRTDLRRVYATSAWLWSWLAQWLCAGREIRGSQAARRFSSVLYGCYQVAPLCLTSPLSETKIIHHHTELFVTTKKTKVLKYYRMGGIYTVLQYKCFHTGFSVDWDYIWQVPCKMHWWHTEALLQRVVLCSFFTPWGWVL